MLSRVLFASAIALSCVCSVSSDFARAAEKDDVKAAGEKPKTKAKPAAKKDASRLPPYYRDVVTEDQRKEVASVYSKFNTKLAKLREEIKTLTAERDQALEALLSKDQKEKIEQLKAEAKEKRAEAAAK